MFRTLALAVLLILASTPAWGLSVNDVIEMTEAGLSDEVIVNQIRATYSRFDLTVDEIIALSRAGISDPVLAYMIATAFEDDQYVLDTVDEPEEIYGIVEVDEEPETRTFVHLGLGYHGYPYSYVWWDYWWPPFDYYWYAGTWCQPAWSWRYRPWHYRSYACGWWYDWCDPCWRHDCWSDWCADRFCRYDSRRDRVRWKSDQYAPRVTLATSRTRMKAIRDADRGRTYSPLARLESKRTKTSTGQGSVVAWRDRSSAKTYKQYGQPVASKTVKRADGTRYGKKSGAVQSITSRGKVTKLKVGNRSRVTITKTKRGSSSDRRSATIRSSERGSSRSKSSASVTRSKTRSSRGSSKATRPSMRSSSRSKSSSSAAAKPSRSKSSSGRSSKSKKR